MDRTSINARCYVLKLIFQAVSDLLKQVNLSDAYEELVGEFVIIFGFWVR